MNTFLYCRKSTDSEDRQVLSLSSQNEEMMKREGSDPELQLIAEFAESRSAKRPGKRPLFEDMLRRVEAGEAQVILCWHPDRLARNMVDGGRIIDLLDTGKLVEIRCASGRYRNTAQDKLNLSILFTFSKYTVDKLADDIARGFDKRAAMGWAPGRPPLGYTSKKEGTPRETIPDPERFQLVERMWRLLLTDTYSVSQILRIANHQWGFTTPKLGRTGGGPLSLSGLYALFSREFYAGIFRYKGRVYQGKHQPMITLDEFARAQGILGRADKPRPVRKTFTYTGLIKCDCGLSITAEEKVNRYGYHYDYYHCTRRRPDGYCRQPYVRAESLEQQITAFLDGIVLAPKAKEWLLQRLERFETGKMAERDAATNSLDTRLQGVATELSTLTQLRLRGMITDEEFTRERSRLEEERLVLAQRREAVSNSRDWIEPARELINFNARAAEYFSSARPHIKRLILETVGSNPVLGARKLSIEARKPFRQWSPSSTVSTMCTFVKDVRTSWNVGDPEFRRTLNDIKRITEAMDEDSSNTLGTKDRAA